MTADGLEVKVSSLLRQAQKAHHDFETTELEGERDEQWAAWYADYLQTNGLDGLIGLELDTDSLAAFLEKSAQDFKAMNGSLSWEDFTAARLLETYA